MKWSFDFKNQKGAWIDEDGYNWDEGELMEAGTYDEDDVQEDAQDFENQLLASDEEQAMQSGWIPNENFDNTYGGELDRDDMEEDDAWDDGPEEDEYYDDGYDNRCDDYDDPGDDWDYD